MTEDQETMRHYLELITILITIVIITILVFVACVSV